MRWDKRILRYEYLERPFINILNVQSVFLGLELAVILYFEQPLR
jgi:hypothetical protein